MVGGARLDSLTLSFCECRLLKGLWLPENHPQLEAYTPYQQPIAKRDGHHEDDQLSALHTPELSKGSGWS